RRLHTMWPRDWSSDVCSSDLTGKGYGAADGTGNGYVTVRGSFDGSLRTSTKHAKYMATTKRTSTSDACRDLRKGRTRPIGSVRYFFSSEPLNNLISWFFLNASPSPSSRFQ